MKWFWLFKGLAFFSFLFNIQPIHASDYKTLEDNKVFRCQVPNEIGSYKITPDSPFFKFAENLCEGMAIAFFDLKGSYKLSIASEDEIIANLQTNRTDVMLFASLEKFRHKLSAPFRQTSAFFYDGLTFFSTTQNPVNSSTCVNERDKVQLDLTLEKLFENESKNHKYITANNYETLWQNYAEQHCQQIFAPYLSMAFHTQKSLPEVKFFTPFAELNSFGILIHTDDDRLYDFVSWFIFALFEAEEKGIYRENIATLQETRDPSTQRLIGQVQAIGSVLKISDLWLKRVIETIGNYGEIYHRHFGNKSNYKLPRLYNELWTKGGLIYAPPMR